MKEKTEPRSIRFDPVVYRWYQRRANKAEMSVCAYIKSVLENYRRENFRAKSK